MERDNRFLGPSAGGTGCARVVFVSKRIYSSDRLRSRPKVGLSVWLSLFKTKRGGIKIIITAIRLTRPRWHIAVRIGRTDDDNFGKIKRISRLRTRLNATV